MTLKSRRDENAEATREELIEKAGLLFGKQGFSKTSLGKIAEDARVTKGAIYHHFKNKEDIFAACYSKQASQVSAHVEKVSLTDDPWLDMINQSKAFLETSKTTRIPIQEAITVLGWEKWRKLDEEHTLKPLIEGVTRLIDHGLLKPYKADLLADAIFGVLIHSMMSLVGARDRKAKREELLLLLEDFISGALTEDAKKRLGK
ncbi:TetR/AcrR family transcriptional regulator [Pseudoteredinibacter isoporae]|uniref:TetR/AcrR family transcriptional repressor of tetCD n=1 Tax=Pseudoteredinibacter isoporae TaxID=570281 RepID=A0A7X0JS52_9GAMM|nr:TetR family transcriptional regulator [Pseudoteredinibacter isoporae]MBB6521285.1 TetR/AcrR family transcriptional repressor of tetCD [Pseudoteredinibacter isoporae]NHO86843.1 TetR/AcrR family transcriptional regulator [Pseudoteredinibacter isoporae]NIB24705.1 TetR/AcrR family transcriptional regulator [Pseudoteredinibacter isoporae]